MERELQIVNGSIVARMKRLLLISPSLKGMGWSQLIYSYSSDSWEYQFQTISWELVIRIRITFPHHFSIVWKEKNIIYMFWFPRCCILHPKYHEFPLAMVILPRGRNPSAMVMSRRGVTGVTGVTMRSCWCQECPSSCVDDFFQLQSGGSWQHTNCQANYL